MIPGYFLVFTLYSLLFSIPSCLMARQSHADKDYQVWADSIIFSDSTAHLFGHVKFTHGNLTIRTIRARVKKNRVLTYDTIVIYEDSVTVFGKNGEYLFEDKKGIIRNGLYGQRGDEIITAKSGEYLKGGKLFFTGSVEYKRNKDDVIIRGEKGNYSFNEKHGIITGAPVLETREKPVKVTGELMEIFNDTLYLVVGKSHFKQEDISAYSDTIKYFVEQDKAYLTGNPCLISKVDTLNGKDVFLIMHEKEVEKVIVKGNVRGRRKM